MDLSDYQQRPSGLYDLYGYQIDNIAEKIVHDLYPHIDTNPEAVDIDEVIEYTLQCNLDYLKLSPDGGVLGVAVVEPDIVYYLSDENKPVPALVPGNTAVIDTRLVMSNDLKDQRRMRFVEGHEAGHLVLGNEYLHRTSKSGLFTSDEKGNGYTSYWFMSEDQISEWQSNRFAAGLLLPKTSVTNEIMEYFSRSSKVYMPPCKDMISHISKLYDVSYSTAYYRLKGIEIFRLMYPKVYSIGDTNFY